MLEVATDYLSDAFSEWKNIEWEKRGCGLFFSTVNWLDLEKAAFHWTSSRQTDGWRGFSTGSAQDDVISEGVHFDLMPQIPKYFWYSSNWVY